MAKIPRKFHKIFANAATAVGNIAKFGSAALLAPDYSSDPEQIQSLAPYDQGWKAATISNRSPEIQDRNALDFQNSYQIAYLHQEGISEWNSQTEYATGGYAKVAGVTYVSKQDLNTNHAVTDTNWWQTLGSFIYADVMKMHYPVGEVYPTRRAGNPASWLGFGTWAQVGAGRVPVVKDAGQTEFAAIDQTGGEKTHILAQTELPNVQISVAASGTTTSAGAKTVDFGGQTGLLNYGDDLTLPGQGTVQSIQTADAHTHDVDVTGQTDILGNGTAHQNLQPYFVAWENFWLRTA